MVFGLAGVSVSVCAAHEGLCNGRSSNVQCCTCLFVVFIVLLDLKWNKFSFLCHSMGEYLALHCE